MDGTPLGAVSGEGDLPGGLKAGEGSRHVSSRPDGESPQPVSHVLDRDDSALTQFSRSARKDIQQPHCDRSGSLVPKAEGDDARKDMTAGRQELAKVEVEGENDALLVSGSGKDLRIVKPLET